MIETPATLAKRLAERRQAEQRAAPPAEPPMHVISDVKLRVGSAVLYEEPIRNYFDEVQDRWGELMDEDRLRPENAHVERKGWPIGFKILGSRGHLSIPMVSYRLTKDLQAAAGRLWTDSDMQILRERIAEQRNILRTQLGLGSGALQLSLSQPVPIAPSGNDSSAFRKYALQARADDPVADYLAQSRNRAVNIMRDYVPGAAEVLRGRDGESFVPGLAVATLRGDFTAARVHQYATRLVALTHESPVTVTVNPEEAYVQGEGHGLLDSTLAK